MHYPKITQPTHARWEHESADVSARIKQPLRLTNGTGEADSESKATSITDSPTSTLFPIPTPAHLRNLLIVDMHFESPGMAGIGIPGAENDVDDITGFGGLHTVKDDVLAELPPECAAAFIAAREKALEWKGRWTTESHDTARGRLRIGF